MKEKKFNLDRRSFLIGGATLVGAAAAGGLSGCAAEGASSDTGGTPQGSSADATRVGDTKTWTQTPDPIDESLIESMVDTDVLVVGGGNAGLYAACAAAEAGVQVTLLEKLDDIGLTARHFVAALNSRLQKEAGVTTDKAEVVETLCQYASHSCDQRLIKLWADNSGMVVDWLESVVAEYDPNSSVHFETDTGKHEGDGYYKAFPVSHNVQTKGEVYKNLQFMTQKTADLGVNIMTGTPMVRLERADGGTGRITGAIAQDSEGAYLRINASKGIILCTGGYGEDPVMLAEENPLDTAQCTSSLAITAMGGNSGDGIKAATWVGATKQKIPTAMVFDRGGVLPGTWGGNLFENPIYDVHFGSQPFLKVNHKGQRFSNESVPYDFIYHAGAEYAESTWCMVWDANWKEQADAFKTIGCARVYPSPTGGEFLLNSIESTEEIHRDQLIPAGVIVEADTVEELAEKLEIPEETFAETVNRYNELCAKGVDEDFGKEAYRMLPLDTPPYRGVTLGGQMLCTLDGLTVNEKLQVMDTNGEVIEGLWAAGNDSGGFFANNYPEYFVGINGGRCITFGYLAGKHAAGA